MWGIVRALPYQGSPDLYQPGGVRDHLAQRFFGEKCEPGSFPFPVFRCAFESLGRPQRAACSPVEAASSKSGPLRVFFYGPAGCDETVEEWGRAQGPALELWVKLATDKERMIFQLRYLHEPAVGRGTGEDHAGLR